MLTLIHDRSLLSSGAHDEEYEERGKRLGLCVCVCVCVVMVKWRDSFSVHSTPDALRSALTSELLTQAVGQKRAALHGAAVVPEEKSLQRGSNRCSQLVSLSHSSLHLLAHTVTYVTSNYQNCI